MEEMTISPCNIDANPKNLKSGRLYCESTFSRFHSIFNAITLHYLQKLSTLPTMLIMDVKSRRFMYQRGRVGDEAKKR